MLQRYSIDLSSYTTDNPDGEWVKSSDVEGLEFALERIVDLWEEEGNWCHNCKDDKADDMGIIASNALPPEDKGEVCGYESS